MYAPTGPVSPAAIQILGLSDPRVFSAYSKGFHHAIAGGMGAVEAAQCCGLTETEFAASMGFLKKLRRSVSRGVREGTRVARGAARQAVRGARTAAQAAIDLHKIPIKLALQAMFKVALPLARVMCRIPKPVLHAGAVAAGVNPVYLTHFCRAVQIRNMAQIRNLLPIALAVGTKIAAQGAFPPIVPALRVIRQIPPPIRKIMVNLFPARFRGGAKVALAGGITGEFFPASYVAYHTPIDRGVSEGW